MICYQFPTRTIWRTLALQTGLAVTVDGEFQLLGGHNIAIDEVGTVVDVEAVLDANGTVITPAVLAPGFHVNLIHPDPPQQLDPYLVVVNSPSRIFLGQGGPVPDDDLLATIETLL